MHFLKYIMKVILLIIFNDNNLIVSVDNILIKSIY